MLAAIVLLLQLHFVRPHFPSIAERQSCGCTVLPPYLGNFTIPKNGQYRLDYKNFYPGQFDGKTVIAAPPEIMEHEDYGLPNKTPIYVVDESYDHITVKSKPGTTWWYKIYLAVPK
jgi:hypothetical protein